jgi:phosphopantothenate---cysteine ligase (CTP)
MALALVTCGPAYEPIDGVRRITNESTGEIGTILSESLSAFGFEVLCLRGEMSRYPAPKNTRVVSFSTNGSLMEILEKLPSQPAAFFHAAALSDFSVRKIQGTEERRKIRSGIRELQITLRPAEKILPRLRTVFPRALIVGWKYELDGTRSDLISLARQQMENSETDGCVVNGSAYGEGFGFLARGREHLRHSIDKTELAAFLAAWSLQAINSQESAKDDQPPPSQSGQ